MLVIMVMKNSMLSTRCSAPFAEVSRVACRKVARLLYQSFSLGVDFADAFLTFSCTR